MPEPTFNTFKAADGSSLSVLTTVRADGTLAVEVYRGSDATAEPIMRGEFSSRVDAAALENPPCVNCGKNAAEHYGERRYCHYAKQSRSRWLLQRFVAAPAAAEGR